MQKHPFDAISFFFGLIFTVGAVSALLFRSDPWPFDRGGVWPILLIVGGGVMLVASLRRDLGPQASPGADQPTVADAVGETSDPVQVAALREIDEYIGPVPDDISAEPPGPAHGDGSGESPDPDDLTGEDLGKVSGDSSDASGENTRDQTA